MQKIWKMILVNQQNFTTNLITELLTYSKWPTVCKDNTSRLWNMISKEAHSYAKKHLHTSSIWIIILKHFRIEALTLGIPWHNLDK